MKDIVSVKKELYGKLKSNNEVIGAGIKGNGKNEHIVIFVTRNSNSIKELIPQSFKGIKVTTEEQEKPRAVNH